MPTREDQMQCTVQSNPAVFRSQWQHDTLGERTVLQARLPMQVVLGCSCTAQDSMMRGSSEVFEHDGSFSLALTSKVAFFWSCHESFRAGFFRPDVHRPCPSLDKIARLGRADRLADALHVLFGRIPR